MLLEIKGVVHIVKSNEPRTAPWGTTQSKTADSEILYLLIKRCNKISISTLSKAVERSNRSN